MLEPPRVSHHLLVIPTIRFGYPPCMEIPICVCDPWILAKVEQVRIELGGRAKVSLGAPIQELLGYDLRHYLL